MVRVPHVTRVPRDAEGVSGSQGSPAIPLLWPSVQWGAMAMVTGDPQEGFLEVVAHRLEGEAVLGAAGLSRLANSSPSPPSAHPIPLGRCPPPNLIGCHPTVLLAART
ncbi:hypothetical protein HispidOSU_025534 [Sigmodon hispidus]